MRTLYNVRAARHAKWSFHATMWATLIAAPLLAFAAQWLIFGG